MVFDLRGVGPYAAPARLVASLFWKDTGEAAEPSDNQSSDTRRFAAAPGAQPVAFVARQCYGDRTG